MSVQRRTPIIEELEPRILYSADVMPLHVPTESASAGSTFDASVSEHALLRHELVFVDNGVEDADTLIAAISGTDDPSVSREVVRISGNEDGIAAITRTLEGRTDVSAVHVVSHGSPGAVVLGSSVLSGDSLFARAAEIARWGDALSTDGDLLFYGCDVASNADGRALVDNLAQLTGADVAASDDLTGAAALGGDWDLEVATGAFVAPLGTTSYAPAQWQGVLAAYTVTNTNDSGAGSLRQAIINANGNSGADSINFSIFGTGIHTINLSSVLPTITGQVTIDATTDDSFAAQGSRPAIVLNGGGSIAAGLRLYGGSDGSTVRGLIVQNFTSQGIEIGGSNGNTIVGNWLGLNSAGTGAAGNGWGVSVYNANNNIIGGSTAADRNVISGNTSNGVALNTDNGTSTGNQVRGNYIGTNATGTAAVGNTAQGVWVNAANNTIGGTASGQGNVISGSTAWVGLELTTQASGTLIAGNRIGTNAAGTAALGNAGGGVYINSANNTIGGTTANARNVISGNGGVGLWFTGASATGNVVIGNYIGTDVTGTLDLNGTAQTNGLSGVFIANGASGNRIGTNADGSNDAAERNIISGNNWYGIEFQDSGTINNIAQGNYIGTDVTGLVALGNSQGGVSFWNGASGNRLGSGVAGAGNVISGNETGVLVANGVTSNKVQGNIIGLGADGSTLVGNTGAGVYFFNGGTGAAVTGNFIGTDNDGSNDAGERNVISGNNFGVFLTDAEVSGNSIAGNYIGTDATGAVDRGNVYDGVHIEGGANANTVGGSSSVQRNVIAGNGQDGVQIDGEASDNNVVRGNRIGVNAAGTAVMGNDGDGIFVSGGADNTLIGGTGANDGNWVAGAGLVGVEVDGASSGTVIQGNRIGTDLAGTANWGSQQNGVLLENGTTGTLVGGTAASMANIIAFSGQGGVYTSGIAVSGAAATGNVFLGNSIYSSAGLAIDNGSDGVTANDTGDADTGANNLQNFPVLTAARSNASNQLILTGSLNSTANSYYRIEFFANTSPDGSGYGEGQMYLGFANVATDGSGNAAISTMLAVNVAVGSYIGATATKSNAAYTTFSETSEFAQDVQATTLNPVPVNTVPGAQTTPEDTPKVFSVANGNAISITDVDAGGANNEITISVTNGTLTLSTTAGLTFTAGDGTADATMTLRGTAAAINAALDGLGYAPTPDYNGGAVLTLSTKDSVLLSLDVDAGLLGRYAFENTGALGTDTSPAAGYPGTVSGVTAVNDPTRGNAISMAGAGYVQTTGHFGDPANVTLAAWVSLTSADTNGAEVISLGDNVLLRVDDATNKLVAWVYSGGGSFTSFSYNATLAGTGWHHVAFSFSDAANTATLYLDGVAVNSTSTAISISYTAGGANSYIGKHGNGSTSYDFNGRIDDARIYNRALTATEIYTLANDQAMTDTDTVAITVTAVNDVPVNVLPGMQTTPTNTTLLLSAASGNAIGVSDVDAGGSALRVTLTASHGTLTLNGTVGLAFSTGDGTADVTMSFSGTAAAINAALDGLGYSPQAGYTGLATITIATDDQGATGSGGAQSDTDILSVAVGGARFQNGVDGYTGTEDTYVSNAAVDTSYGNADKVQSDDGAPLETGLVRFDNMFGGSVGQIPLYSTINGAMLSIYVTNRDAADFVELHRMLSNWSEASTYNSLGSGVQTDGIEAASSAEATLDAGALGWVNIAVSTATVQAWANGAANYGWAFVSDAADHWAFASSEHATTAWRPYLTLDFTPPQAPVVNATGGSTSYVENAAPTAVDAGVTVSDADSPNLVGATVSITSNYASGQDVLGFVDQSGITGSWNASTGVLSLSGSATVAQYQTALRSITYGNSSDAPGSATRTVSFVVNDGTGSSNAATRDITVTAVNDAPFNTMPGAQATPPNTPLVLGGASAIQVSDVDAGSLQVTLTATNGTISLSGLAGLSFSSGDGVADTSMTFSGTTAAINAALDGLQFTPGAGYLGAATLTIQSSDLGATGSGGVKSDSDTLTIHVSAVQFREGVNGYTGTADTFVRQYEAFSSFGNNTEVELNSWGGFAEHGLIRFDNVFGSSPGEIPYGSTITSASLSVYVSHANNTNGSATVSLYRMLAGWSESSTWSGMNNGIQTNGSEASSSASQTISAAQGGWMSFNNLSADLQIWANGATNQGWALITSDIDAWNFYSSEAASAQRPYLTLSFTPPQSAVINTSGGSATYVENGAAVAVDPGLTLSDADSSQLTGAAIAITGGFRSGEDTLAFTNQSGISGSWNAGTGVLTLSGTASVAQYQSALRSVTYADSSDAPDTGIRTVSFTASDAYVTSSPATRDISVTAINDAPVVTATGAALAYSENQAPVAVDTGLTVSDVDNANITSATVSISANFANGEDVLAFADQSGITGSWNASTGVLTLSGSATVAQYQTALRSVSYSNSSDTPSTATRTVSFVVSDGTVSSSAATRDISVAAVNDAPVLDSASLTVSEGQTVTLSGANFGITDPDSTSFTYTVSAVSGGYFQLSGTPITSFTSADLTGGLVQFVDDGNEAAPSFDVTVNDGTADSNTRSATISYTPVNDAPVLDSASLTLSEGQTVTLSGANFGITDPDSMSFTYTVSAVSGGYFQLSNAAGTPITSFTSADLSGGLVQFVDDGNEAAPSFDVTVNDGTADSNTRSATISYTPVNDTPVLDSASLTVSEGQTVTLSGANFGITDPDSMSFTYTVSAVSGGYFQLSNAAGTPITSFTSADLTGGLVQFVDDGNEAAPSFDVTVNDGTVDSNTRSATISYTPVNDAPVLDSASLTLSEGQTVTLSGANFGITDPDSMSFTYTVSAVSGGYFQLSNAAGTPITSFTSADLTGGLVQFVDDGNEVAPSFDVTVNDGTADSNTRSATISYTPVNDTPVLDGASLTVSEGQTVTLSGANFGITDPDSTSFTYTVSAVSGGYFQLSNAAGTPITSFTSADLTGGLVQFVDDGNEAAPSFDVTVNDGTADSNTRSATISYTAVNDAPVLDSASLTLSEGQTVTLSGANFGVTDPDSASFTYTVSAVTGGYFQLSSASGTPITSFTSADLTGGLVQFVDDGNEAAPSFDVTVNDGTVDSNTRSATISYTPVNDTPVLDSASLTVSEGQTVTLSGANFGITDPDSTSFTYTVSAVTGGYFQLSSASGTPITSFTSADLTGGLVQFVDDGNEAAPSFDVTVNDGTVDSNTRSATISYTPVNDTPVLDSASLTVSEGQTVTLSGANFGITDPDSASFTYTVSAVTGGYFQLSNAAGSPITSFTSADLSGGLVQFVDDGNEVAPSFDVTVNDGTADSNTRSATISYTPVNDAPVLDSASLTLSEGQTVTLSGANFGVTDPDSTSFTYAVSAVSGGYFQLSSASGTPITSFTSADLTGGLVQFVDDGNEVAPSFAVTVNDVIDNSNTVTATVSYTLVNDVPWIESVAVSVRSGQSVTLGTANLLARDEDSALDSLRYEVSAPSSGHWLIGGVESTSEVATFTQGQLVSGDVSYVAAQGSDGPPVFKVRVGDGESWSGWRSVRVSMTASVDAGLPEIPVSGGRPGDTGTPGASPGADTSPDEGGATVVPPADTRSHGAAGAVFETGPRSPGALSGLSARHIAPDSVDYRNRSIDGVFQGAGVRFDIGLLLDLEGFRPLLTALAGSSSTGDFVVQGALLDGLAGDAQETTAIFSGVTIAGTVLSVGVVWWATRIAGLVGSLMVSMPVWRTIDPLPVLGPDDDGRQGDGPDLPAADEAAFAARHEEAAAAEVLTQYAIREFER